MSTQNHGRKAHRKQHWVPGGSPRSVETDITPCTATGEIFLRELISNASDAASPAFRSNLQTRHCCPRLRSGNQTRREFKAGTVTIRDNGIGMTREDRLPTRHHRPLRHCRVLPIPSATSRKTPRSWPFGVGFYSAFIVSDRVELFRAAPARPRNRRSRESSADGISPWKQSRPGTRHCRTLHLKEDAKGVCRRLAPALPDPNTRPYRLPVRMRKEGELL